MGICNSKPAFDIPTNRNDLFGGSFAKDGFVEYALVPSQSAMMSRTVGVFRCSSSNSNYSSESIPLVDPNALSEYTFCGGLRGFKLQYGDPIKNKSYGKLADIVKGVAKGSGGSVAGQGGSYTKSEKITIKIKLNGGIDSEIAIEKKWKIAYKDKHKATPENWTEVVMTDNSWTVKYQNEVEGESRKDKKAEVALEPVQFSNIENMDAAVADYQAKQAEINAKAEKEMKSKVLELSLNGLPVAILYEGAADYVKLQRMKTLRGGNQMAQFKAEYCQSTGLQVRESLREDERIVTLALIAALSKDVLILPFEDRGVPGPPHTSNGRRVHLDEEYD